MVPLLLATCVAPTLANGCTIRPSLFDVNQRVFYTPKGAFTGAGKRDDVPGDRFVDMGSGLVRQTITVQGTCLSDIESVMFVDCITAQIAFVQAPNEDDLAEGEALEGESPLEKMLPPDGLLTEPFKRGFSEIKVFAAEHALLAPPWLLDLNANEEKKDRFDPFYGCKIYYPDMPGATQ